eukprot:6209773-Pleurochrysis_carterae.AAC.2
MPRDAGRHARGARVRTGCTRTHGVRAYARGARVRSARLFEEFVGGAALVPVGEPLGLLQRVQLGVGQRVLLLLNLLRLCTSDARQHGLESVTVSKRAQIYHARLSILEFAKTRRMVGLTARMGKTTMIKK